MRAGTVFVSLIAGFVLLLVGGEFLVRGASALASRLGISALVVGIVVVGFGTSAPELVTSVQAALSGAPGLAVGNIVGSNIANILLILGAGALILVPRVAEGASGLLGIDPATGQVALSLLLAGIVVPAHRRLAALRVFVRVADHPPACATPLCGGATASQGDR